MTYAPPPLPPPTPLAEKNGKALAALILGIIGLVLSPVVVGGLIGIVALILGIMALRVPMRRGMAVAGIVMGAVAIPMMFVGPLMIAILLPSLSRARVVARETVAMSKIRSLDTCVQVYAAEYGGYLPARIADVGPYMGGSGKVLLDPRQTTEPLPAGTDWAKHPEDVEAHCDFYYAGGQVRLSAIKHPSAFILFYDHAGAGRSRVIGFADGHVERIPAASTGQIDLLVEESNKARAAAGLAPLPARLSGPPAAAAGTMPEGP